MKYLDFDSFMETLDSEFLAELDTITNKLMNEAVLAKKYELIDEYSHVWSTRRKLFFDFSNNKCWYSEALVVNQDCELEHFRPKKHVIGEKKFGYWWLAFNIYNYRLSSSMVNKKRKSWITEQVVGKGCEFPLINPEDRVRDPLQTVGRDLSLGNELPVIFDPCSKSDVEKISYSLEGKVIPAVELEEEDAQRLKNSTKILNLDSSRCVLRRQKVSERLERMIQSIRVLNSITPKNPEIVSLLKLEYENLESYILPSAEFLSTAIGILRKNLEKEPWISKFLDKYNYDY